MVLMWKHESNNQICLALLQALIALATKIKPSISVSDSYVLSTKYSLPTMCICRWIMT